jgi:hypothetical protein
LTNGCTFVVSGEPASVFLEISYILIDKNISIKFNINKEFNPGSVGRLGADLIHASLFEFKIY